ncbi:MAG TPA: hypothetical protein VMU19_09995 [Bryobacteraceae bacterium]|nr:hypothetical protein [Bryobacteraceae bacterium]
MGRRFPLKMDVVYRLTLRGQEGILSEGTSQTVNISHSGVLLDMERPFPPGVAAELMVKWPVAAEEVTPLQLHLLGSVVRVDQRGTAVKVSRHDFERWQGGFAPAAAPEKPVPESASA